MIVSWKDINSKLKQCWFDVKQSYHDVEYSDIGSVLENQPFKTLIWHGFNRCDDQIAND